MIKINPVTTAFKNIQHNGRVQLTGLLLPNNVLLIVANVYCWTNGHTCTAASTRSDDMLHIVVEELACHPHGPRIILGDLNADPEDLPTLHHHLHVGDLIDIGAHPNFCQ
eukprot:2668924-Karenia_brevis.AAC.1